MCIKKRPNKDLAWQPLVLAAFGFTRGLVVAAAGSHARWNRFLNSCVLFSLLLFLTKIEVWIPEQIPFWTNSYFTFTSLNYPHSLLNPVTLKAVNSTKSPHQNEQTESLDVWKDLTIMEKLIWEPKNGGDTNVSSFAHFVDSLCKGAPCGNLSSSCSSLPSLFTCQCLAFSLSSWLVMNIHYKTFENASEPGKRSLRECSTKH